MPRPTIASLEKFVKKVRDTAGGTSTISQEPPPPGPTTATTAPVTDATFPGPTGRQGTDENPPDDQKENHDHHQVGESLQEENDDGVETPATSASQAAQGVGIIGDSHGDGGATVVGSKRKTPDDSSSSGGKKEVDPAGVVAEATGGGGEEKVKSNDSPASRKRKARGASSAGEVAEVDSATAVGVATARGDGEEQLRGDSPPRRKRKARGPSSGDANEGAAAVAAAARGPKPAVRSPENGSEADGDSVGVDGAAPETQSGSSPPLSAAASKTSTLSDVETSATPAAAGKAAAKARTPTSGGDPGTGQKSNDGDAGSSPSVPPAKRRRAGTSNRNGRADAPARAGGAVKSAAADVAAGAPSKGPLKTSGAPPAARLTKAAAGSGGGDAKASDRSGGSDSPGNGVGGGGSGSSRGAR